MEKHARKFATGIVAALFLLAAASASAAAPEPKTLFVDNDCIACHTIKAEGVLQPPEKADPEDPPKDLSDVGTRHDAAFIEQWLQKKVEQNGKTHRKRFGGKPEELKVLATWLAGLKKTP